ncbi:unnamed protein product [Rotaria sp. Silwood2]|nr:unnamed protein product [Rotaria sp. Silwood2]CAF2967204.1 unnamed protein product [Rotaria sp. Silwood2]CAF3296331.1 unnamed protein product [Rotaria sp. Silwood2]CAF3296709.1 unnamed protein product [Rotaria sp. Silwood2]CAF3987725.1 unnamed protein product [Rotaria sp. Silwood2]
MSSTFETLPDEVLMLIFNYSGDSSMIFQTFLGLNQRLNNILVDKRLHLLANFLHIGARAANFDDNYNSVEFQDVSRRLSFVNTTVNEQELDQYFYSLIVFYIRQQYTQLEDQIQSTLEKCQSVRQQFATNEIVDADRQLKKSFNDLLDYPVTRNSVKTIETLVFSRGARLECSDDELNQYNLATAINKLLLIHLNNVHAARPLFIYSVTRMFKALIISNIRLLNNRGYTGNGGCKVWYFLFYSVYQLQYFYYTPPDVFINMKCYRAVLDLLLFAIQCQKHAFNIQRWAEESIFDILDMIYSIELAYKNGILIKTIQYEILNIIIDNYVSTVTAPWDENLNEKFRSILSSLIKKNRLDIVLLLHRRIEHVQHFFNQLRNNPRKGINFMTGSRIGRELFNILIEKKPLETCFTDKELLFILLQKKERKSLQKLLQLSPLLLDQSDENGNDPLLYVCLKVRGCRHRIVEFLLKIGCNPQRQNFNGENFVDAIKLSRNRTLLEKLVEEAVIKIDDESGMVQLILEEQKES